MIQLHTSENLSRSCRWNLDLNVGGGGGGGNAEGAVLSRASAFAEAGEGGGLVGKQLGRRSKLDDATRIQNEDAV